MNIPTYSKLKTQYGISGIILLIFVIAISYTHIQTFLQGVDIFQVLTYKEREVLNIKFEIVGSLFVSIISIYTIYLYSQIKQSATSIGLLTLIASTIFQALMESHFSGTESGITTAILGLIYVGIFYSFLSKQVDQYLTTKDSIQYNIK